MFFSEAFQTEGGRIPLTKFSLYKLLIKIPPQNPPTKSQNKIPLTKIPHKIVPPFLRCHFYSPLYKFSIGTITKNPWTNLLLIPRYLFQFFLYWYGDQTLTLLRNSHAKFLFVSWFLLFVESFLIWNFEKTMRYVQKRSQKVPKTILKNPNFGGLLGFWGLLGVSENTK